MVGVIDLVGGRTAHDVTYAYHVNVCDLWVGRSDRVRFRAALVCRNILQRVIHFDGVFPSRAAGGAAITACNTNTCVC